MNDEYQNVILAALFHDIGKFYQRAGFKLNLGESADSYAYTAYTKKSKGIYTHVHAAFTAKFFSEYLSNFSEAEVLASLHHVPENGNNEQQRFLATLIALADRMSSGERQDRDEQEESGNPQEEPLTSIFSLVNNNGDQTKEYYQPLTYLEPSLDSFFPVENRQEAFKGRRGEEAYRELWNNFIQEFQKLNHQDILIQAYYLLYKYTLSIPAAVYKDKPDISLFHHLKTTAALAACLYILYQSGKINNNKLNQIIHELTSLKETPLRQDNSPLIEEDFLLVSGDISGIQDFIYNVTSEKALKGLRARSFYLQLLSEILARRILQEFNLTEVNLLYCGGGNFYIILPNTEQTEARLNSLQREIDEILLSAHKGQLATVLSWIPVTYYDFFHDFAHIWENLGKSLLIKKRKKFASLASSGTPSLFQEIVLGPFEAGGRKKSCQICGEEIDEENRERCQLCESLIEFSNQLVNASSFLLEAQEPKPLPPQNVTLTDIIESLGFRFKFLRKTDREKFRALIINSTDFAGQYRGFTFVARKARTSQGEILTLEDIAAHAVGVKKWGVLRADVDHLGNLFRTGLGKNKTISRISTLSSMLALYFSARISQLDYLIPHKEEVNNLTEAIYIAYSGGDDLFLIGPWSALVDLAKYIYDDFSKFACYKLKLSAGIFFSPTRKFPIYQAAALAGEAEDKAKNEGRDRLTVFGESLPWSCYPEIKAIINLVVSLLKGEKGKELPRSLINILYNVYLEKELTKKQKPHGIPMERVWRFYYSLKKLIDRLNEQQRADLERLLELVITNYEVYPYLNIATRIADYLTRKDKEALNELS